MTDPVHEPPPLTVLYDGACPLCRREIDVYRGLRPNAPVCFADVSDPASQLPSGTTREQLLARFHVRGSDGIGGGVRECGGGAHWRSQSRGHCRSQRRSRGTGAQRPPTHRKACASTPSRLG